MNSYYWGLDLGQKQDHTAIAAVERAELKGAFDYGLRAYRKEIVLRLRYLERVPLGTPYPEVAYRVGRLLASGQLGGRNTLVVDGTGVGAPVVDLLRLQRLDATLMPVVVTGGERERHVDGSYRVPKRDVIAGLQLLLEGGGLQIANGIPLGEALRGELMEMRTKVTEAGHEQYGAWREGTHDDLVFAVALACWAARKAGTEGGWWTNEYQERMERVFGRSMRGQRPLPFQ